MTTTDVRPVRDIAPPTAATRAPAGHRAIRAAIWLPGLAVALGAAVATAHGLYEVAVASRVPAGFAWLYPLITDGLALVAYAATARLHDGGRRYAWAVVILAAGLSGLAQAAYLATDGAGSGPAGFVAPTALRFGVGAWPAVAAAIVAHLLYLLASDESPEERPAADECSVAEERPPSYVRTTVQPYDGAFTAPSSNGHRPAFTTGTPSLRPTPDGVPSDEPFTRPLPVVPRPSVRELDAPARDRARAAAMSHVDEHGIWPTVTQLMNLAEVSRGTAGEALKHLRDQPPRPQHDRQTTDQEPQP